MANSESAVKLDLSDVEHRLGQKVGGGPAFEGDVTFIDGEVVDRIEQSTWGFPVVQVKVTMTNQDGKIIVTALNEVELPY